MCLSVRSSSPFFSFLRRALNAAEIVTGKVIADQPNESGPSHERTLYAKFLYV